MSFPEWADEELSLKLPKLRAQGEGQSLEFKRELGRAGDEIKKEIAAFASTNAGLILIGVDDDGSLVGLSDVDTAKKREQFRAQVEGRARSVSPPVTPAIKYLVEDGKIVLALEVRRGAQPVYYSNNIPYVRHITQAQPADPQEVIERVKAWLDTGGAVEAEKEKEFLTSLAQKLIGIIIYCREYEHRMVDPWVDRVKYTFQAIRSDIAQMAASQIAEDNGCGGDLFDLALALDKVTTHYWTLSSGPEQLANVSALQAKAEAIKAKMIDVVPLDSASRSDVGGVLKQKSRELANLTGQAEAMAFSRMDDLREGGHDIGEVLMRLSLYNLSFIDPTFSERLIAIAQPLHLIETESVYFDGGRSQRRVIDIIANCNEALLNLVATTKL